MSTTKQVNIDRNRTNRRDRHFSKHPNDKQTQEEARSANYRGIQMSLRKQRDISRFRTSASLSEIQKYMKSQEDTQSIPTRTLVRLGRISAKQEDCDFE